METAVNTIPPHNDVFLWLRNNKHLDYIGRMSGVYDMMYGLDYQALLEIAVAMTVTSEDLDFRFNRVDEELPKLARKIKRDTETSIHKEQGGTANAGRVAKFAVIEKKLKEYWIDNIDPSMGNNKAAKKLIETAIYTQSVTKPELGTVAGYVGKWKK
jgi:hypothetical protein